MMSSTPGAVQYNNGAVIEAEAKIMVYRGHMENGVVRLDDSPALIESQVDRGTTAGLPAAAPKGLKAAHPSVG
jgi:hypothetical protein